MKLKTWEMIKALSENPTLKFKNDISHVVKISKRTKSVVWDLICEEEPFVIVSNSGMVDNLHLEWELVCEEVDFMTAANSGKRIRPINYTIDGFMYFDEWEFSLEDINGKWLVE